MASVHFFRQGVISGLLVGLREQEELEMAWTLPGTRTAIVLAGEAHAGTGRKLTGTDRGGDGTAHRVLEGHRPFRIQGLVDPTHVFVSFNPMLIRRSLSRELFERLRRSLFVGQWIERLGHNFSGQSFRDADLADAVEFALDANAAYEAGDGAARRITQPRRELQSREELVEEVVITDNALARELLR